ncbi:MAG: DEAD/DEAH box helicase [Parachlamydiaceae bacterium]|nr:DEAD/DEAH box helicase [Parachlamydiaceae bacterium]
MTQFQDLNLDPKILQAIEEAGYTTPTPIQEQAIPQILAGFDLRASAQTGTGKTAAFILPALNRLMTPSPVNASGPRVLILVPTRELAMQVAAEAVKYSKHLTRVKTVCIYGGAPYPIQNRELSRHYEILVATPGRLIDHMESGRINFSRLEMLVLDEADRMLDMGFIEPVEQIAAATPKERQTLLFSATLKGSVLQLSRNLLKDPKEIEVSSPHEKHENIDQRLHHADNIDHKNRLLEEILTDETVTQVIIFTSTKHHADQLADQLAEIGHDVAALHGDMNQRQRSRTILQMRQGKLRVLVATDVAARGLDVQSITHVINFDLPTNVEDYVHRIGRTGRAGAKGVAWSFAASRDLQVIKRIEQFTGQKMNLQVIPGFEATFKMTGKSTSAGPSRRGGGGGGGGGRPSRSGGRPNSRPMRSNDGPRFSREERPAGERSERPSREPRERAFNREERPAFNREPRTDRPAFNRAERPGNREERPAFNREPRTDRPAFNKEERPAFNKEERPAFNREPRTDRPPFNKEERPAFNRERTFAGGNRDRFGSDSRPQSGGGYGRGKPGADGERFGNRDKPRFDGDRPQANRNRPSNGRFGQAKGKPNPTRFSP